MMMRRMGRPGLMGTMARTAVVAGTATAVSGNVASKQAARAQANAPAAPPAQAQAQAPAAAPVTAGSPAGEPAGDDLSSQIERLSTLKTAGVITDAEFSAAKARLLGI
ncbi:MAG: SHOCT domain-containing protein [Cryobacterium sp.]